MDVFNVTADIWGDTHGLPRHSKNGHNIVVWVWLSLSIAMVFSSAMSLF